MKVIQKSDRLDTFTQNMESYGAGVWSSGAQLLVKSTKVGAFVELEIPAVDAAAKQLILYITQSNDFDI